MFKTGRKVVLLPYGLGLMEGIRREEISGRKETFCVIKIGKTRILIPAERAERGGLREVIKKKEVSPLFEKLCKKPRGKRGKRTMGYEKIKKKAEEGNAFQMAEALCELFRKKTLDSKEKDLFNSIKEVLIDELVWVQKMPKKKVERMVDEALKKK